MLTITECYESGNGSVGQERHNEYNVIVTGLASDNADDPFIAAAFAASHLPTTVASGAVLNTLGFERVAPLTWKIKALYKDPTYQRLTNDSSFSFTTGGGTQHITHALQRSGGPPAQVAYNSSEVDTNTGEPYPAPNVQGGINVTKDGVGGVDIHTRSFDFKLTFYVPWASMTADAIDLLFMVTGCVNSDSVEIDIDGIALSFDPGELLFLGAEGSKRVGFYDWELALSFSASPNEDSLQIGSGDGLITIDTKNGWDYLWVMPIPDVDEVAYASVQTPLAAYVAKVYRYMPLSELVQGTAFSLTGGQGWLNPPTTAGSGIGF